MSNHSFSSKIKKSKIVEDSENLLDSVIQLQKNYEALQKENYKLNQEIAYLKGDSAVKEQMFDNLDSHAIVLKNQNYSGNKINKAIIETLLYEGFAFNQYSTKTILDTFQEFLMGTHHSMK